MHYIDNNGQYWTHNGMGYVPAGQVQPWTNQRPAVPVSVIARPYSLRNVAGLGQQAPAAQVTQQAPIVQQASTSDNLRNTLILLAGLIGVAYVVKTARPKEAD